MIRQTDVTVKVGNMVKVVHSTDLVYPSSNCNRNKSIYLKLLIVGKLRLLNPF